MHHCGPGEIVTTVLGMQDVPHVFGDGSLVLRQHTEGMRMG